VRDVFLIGFASALLLLAIRKPYLFVLSYTWAEILTPQNIAIGPAKDIPFSLIYAVGAAIFAPIAISKRTTKIPLSVLLLLCYGGYMTGSLSWSIYPDVSIDIWNPAVKVVIFCIITLLYIDTKRDLEAYILTIVIAGFAHTLTIALKTLLGGVGYGRDVGLVTGNSGFGEGSTMGMFAIYLIPLSIFLYKQQSFISSANLNSLLFRYLIPASCLLAAFGTHSRTGFLCVIVLAALWIFSLKTTSGRLFLPGIFAISILFFYSDSSWLDRMLSTTDSTESSAMGRIAVWKWTIDFVSSNPFGGGFGAYLASEFELPLINGEILKIQGKAFHSIYFEILGTLGYIGIGFFMIFVLQIYLSLKGRPLARMRSEDSIWFQDLRQATAFSLIVYLFGGLFIGIAFKAIFFYLFAISIALNVIRSEEYRD
jgi:probable O-glycosylation ligase (exosortase A-associated)